MNGEAAEWLREQITKRMETAKKATPGPWREDGMAVRGCPVGTIAAPGIRDTLVVKHTWPQEAAHIIANDPQDTIARCEAELGILGLYDLWAGKDASCHPALGAAACAVSDAVRHVASGYRHRPGYGEHWEGR